MSAIRQNRNSYLPSLDGWRAIAIFAVLCSHDPDSHGIGFINTSRLHQVGWAGVDLFFAISGLLICSRLLEEEQMNGTISLRGFYIRRAFRILPVAYAFLLVCLLLGLANQIPYSVPATLAAALMIRNYWGVFTGDPPQELYTDHFWSLSVEEHFYLILPAALLLIKRRILFLAILSAAAFSWLLYFAHRGWVTGNLTLSRTDLRLQGLMIPAVLALLLAKPHLRSLAGRWLRPWFCIGLVGLLSFGLHNVPFEYRIALVGLCFPFLVASTMIHPDSIACRVLEWKPLRYIGRLSYGIYLWQQIYILRPRGTAWPFAVLQTFPFNYLALACSAAAGYYLLERPMMRLGHRVAPPATPGRLDLNENLRQDPQTAARPVIVTAFGVSSGTAD